MRKYSFTLFPCFCFRLLWLGLYFWILFQFCGLTLYFFCECFRLGMLTSVLGFVFLFSGSVFLFWVCSLLFLLLLLLSCGFFCFYRPPYIFLIVLCILNPTTAEHFKTPLKISSQRSNRPGKK